MSAVKTEPSITYQIELPSNVRKRFCCRLKINEVRKRNGAEAHSRALGSYVVWKQFAVEHHSANIDPKAVDDEEDVECSHSNSKTGFVGAGFGILGDHYRRGESVIS